MSRNNNFHAFSLFFSLTLFYYEVNSNMSVFFYVREDRVIALFFQFSQFSLFFWGNLTDFPQWQDYPKVNSIASVLSAQSSFSPPLLVLQTCCKYVRRIEFTSSYLSCICLLTIFYNTIFYKNVNRLGEISDS